ncbi:DUF397 domain-containing protein [Streptomyces sp. NPDC051597]|uniref:DUF397 domain-containing protein n=1 Tax=Streptomyces sp. NPDC051597 TaxID=3155049 RepID=UPI00343177DC
MRVQQPALTDWTKSSYSAVNGDCVEIKAADHSTVSVRDSKNPLHGKLDFAPETWSAFLQDVNRTSPRGV